MPTTVNTGKKIYNTLTQIFTDSGEPTGSTKTNDPDDPDYIDPVIDTTACPPPTPPDVLVNQVVISIINNTTQSMSLNNLVIRPQSLSTPYYSNANFGSLPGATFNAPSVQQLDDLSHIFFGVTALSKKIRTHIQIKYKQSNETTPSVVYDADFVEQGTVDAQFPTARVANSSDTNNIYITFTENPLPPPVTYPPPVVDAGSPQNLILPVSSCTLSGTASSPNGSIASVAWTQVSGPISATIGTPNGITTAITGLVTAGTYVFQFSATDNLGQSSSDTVSVIVAPNPNGVVNMYVDSAMPDNTFQITQIQLYNITSPNNPVINLLDTPINKTNGVTIKTPPKGTYRMVITVAGSVANTKSLVVSWAAGGSMVSFLLPVAGSYCVDNVVVDEGGNGVLVTYKATAVVDPTFTIVWAKMTTSSDAVDSQNTLPNGLIITTTNPVTVSFYSDAGGTTPTPYTGNVIDLTMTTNNLNSTTNQTYVSNPISAQTSAVIATAKRYQVYDYTQATPNTQDTSYTYSLQPGQGYLIIP